MKAKIVTPARPAIQTREELEAAAGQVAALLIERDETAAEMNAALQQVREHFEPRLARLDADVAPLLADVKGWAEEHRLTAFGEKRSLDLLHATIGFRTGNPRLGLRRGVKWNMVLDMLKTVLGGAYVRSKEEVDREGLLRDREALGAGKLARLGVEVVQDEAFFLEPKREDLPAVPGTR
jgi:phage host-nuclease inhibitor protein Gam